MEVSLEKGLATIDDEARECGYAETAAGGDHEKWIHDEGIECDDCRAGVVENGKAELKISGSNDVLSLIAENQSAADAKAMNGKFVVVQGTIPEAAKNKVPDAIRYQSIVEEGK